MQLKPDGCKVFDLHERLLHLLKMWLLRFVRPDSLPTPVWRINVDDSSMWLGPYNLSYGEPARRIFADLTATEQSMILEKVKLFFKKGTEKLLKYLPFENEVLEAAQFLSPSKMKDPKFEEWVKTLIKASRESCMRFQNLR